MDELSLAMAWMEDQYHGMAQPPEDWSSRENFMIQVYELDRTSSPGWPYMTTATTIGQWLQWDEITGPSQQRVEMLWHDVQLVMSGNFEHLFRVFVKDEPHKREKILAKRWRLIIASALPVQMVWRMLFDAQNKWLNEHPYQTPSAHGLVYAHGGWRRYMAAVKSMNLNHSRDISGWDVNAPGWALSFVRAFRARMAKQSSGSWNVVAKSMYSQAFRHACLLFSDGTVMQQQYRGFMKSGLFNTISDNSLAMVVMHFIASIRSGLPVGSVWATGDDVLQSFISDDYIRELQRLGCKVKCVEPVENFMGTVFKKNGPQPAYFSKHVVNFALAKQEVRAETLDSYLRLYCHSPRFEFWMQVARLLKIKVRSRAYYRFWYDSPLSKIFNTLFG